MKHKLTCLVLHMWREKVHFITIGKKSNRRSTKQQTRQIGGWYSFHRQRHWNQRKALRDC